MFNNLGMYGGLGLNRPVIHTVRRVPVRRLLPMARRAPVVGNSGVIANLGGYGNDIINIGGSTVPGPPGPPGPPGTIGLVPVMLVTTTPFTPTLEDYLLEVNVAGLASIVLPVSPTGTVFIIKDISGLAFTNLITITATGGVLIDSSATALINANYGSATLIFNGTEWSIV